MALIELIYAGSEVFHVCSSVYKTQAGRILLSGAGKFVFTELYQYKR